MTDEQKTKIIKNLMEVDETGALAQEFHKDPEKFMKEGPKILEGYSSYTDKYRNFYEFIGDRNKPLRDLYDDLKGDMPSGARILSFKKKHPDISEQEIVDYFNKTNQYKKQYEQEREEEAGRIRRSREINEEWSLPKKLLTSDYEQERYIRDPQSASFGKESAGILGSSLGSKLDLATGALAAGADFVPGPIAAGVGPAIRFSRDVAHVASDSPYRKSGSQIAADLAADLGTNYAAFGLANARKISRIAKNMASPEIGRASCRERV